MGQVREYEYRTVTFVGCMAPMTTGEPHALPVTNALVSSHEKNWPLLYPTEWLCIQIFIIKLRHRYEQN
jgi:hypothetical protein